MMFVMKSTMKFHVRFLVYGVILEIDMEINGENMLVHVSCFIVTTQY